MTDSKISILVVDDEKDLCAIMADGLTRAGFAVSTAHCGAEAFHRCMTTQFTVLITDIRMHSGTGDGLIRALIAKHKKPPILFCISGYSDFDLEDAFKLGVDAFFPKPFKIGELVAATRHFLDLHSRLNQKSLPAPVNELQQSVQGIKKIQAVAQCMIETLSDKNFDSTVLESYALNILEKSRFLEVGLRLMQETQNQAPTQTEQTLKHVISSSVETYKAQFADAKSVKLNVDLSEGEFNEVDDPNRLSQTLLYLMQVANGTMNEMEQKEISLRSTVQDGTIQLTISFESLRLKIQAHAQRIASEFYGANINLIRKGTACEFVFMLPSKKAA